MNQTSRKTANISFLFCSHVGSGKIYHPGNKPNSLTPDQVSTLICSPPDCSRYMKENTTIQWTRVYSSLFRYRVIGELIDVEPECLSDSSTDETIVSSSSSTPDTVNFDQRSTTVLNRNDILNSVGNAYQSHSVLQWADFRIGKKDKNDGRIPTEWLNDPVYLSMNLPSESRSDFMIEAWRDNGHFIDTFSDVHTQTISIGAIYPTHGAQLPDEFSLCIGKMKLFAFSKSQNKWITLDSKPYPPGIYIYTLPWPTATATKCQNVTYHDDYAEIKLTADELNGNALHFWGKLQPLDKEDYTQFAAAYEVWTNDSNVSDLLTATIGVDVKDQDMNHNVQLFCGRGLSINKTKKVHWGHTVANGDYSYYRDGVELLKLFNEPAP
ncbi:MAG: hypothetical protein E7277_00135 [Lachnospiraceae bacterium]|nr:hypothetical protein [Lachnospiraceae bacterium]